MLSRLFLWFYCLPIPQVLLLTALLTVVLFLIHHRLSRYRLWTVMLCVLLLAGCFVILWQTVLGRSPGSFRPPLLQPLQSYREVLDGGNAELLRSNLMNMLLFYPLGLCAALLLSRKIRPFSAVLLVTLLLGLLSCGIEYAQLRWGLGLCEVDDVLHNTLGAFLGALVGSQYPSIFPD